MLSGSPAIRLWPAIGVLAIQGAALVFTVTAEFDNLTRFIVMMAAPLACLLLFLVYWFGFSRVPKREKLVIFLVALVAAPLVAIAAHSTARAPMWVYGVPLVLLIVTAMLAIGRSWNSSARTLATSLLIVAGWSAFLLVRLDGFDGSYWPEFAWRWSPTAEELLVESRTDASPAAEVPLPPIALSEGDWPGFRGAQRDSRVLGVTINDDWTKKPPQEIWSRDVGPGWSSFAVVGGALFTQEQLGAMEAVVCYDAVTGAERWKHVDEARFNELVAGPGPRGTPTFHEGKVYTLGAKANLNCLDAATGKVIWAHDLMKEIGAKLPEWGFAASPLVIAGVVVVNADGENDHGLVAYRADTGAPAWHVPSKGMNFSSPQRAFLMDKECLLFTTNEELLALEPATGAVLWRHKPTGWSSAPMVQPQPIDGSSLIVALGDGVGTARLSVGFSADKWSVKEDWTSKNLKPAFNDFVYHDGALYGFDQNIFACIDAQTGARKWKKGRYGFGQVLLFEEQGRLLVMAESGEIVLLACDAKQSRELGRMQAIDGKTWNHPAFAQGRLYVRNGEEAACIDLSP